MLVKFIPTKTAGTSIDAVLSYVFQRDDSDGKPRPVVRQVAGTMPELLSLMSLDIPSKNPYTHSVLALSDTDIERTTEAQRLEILDSYIDELAAGLCDKGRMPYLAVDHGDHYHVVTVRYDLATGKIYQPFVTARGDTQRFNAWKDVQNRLYGLDAPTKAGTLFRLSAKHASEQIENLVWLLNNVGRDVVDEAGGSLPAFELLQELKPVIEEEGFEIARVTKSGFSVTTPTMKRNVRIQFTRKALGIVDDKKDEDVDELRERLACFREKLMLSMGRYHQPLLPDFKRDMKEGTTPLYCRHCMDRKSGNEIPTFSAMS